jgi:hypothetical protein
MLTRMTEQDWAVVLEVFRAARSGRGDKGRDDRRFLEALTSSRSTTSPGGRSLPSSGPGTVSGSASGT